MALIRRSIFAIEDLMKPSASVKSVESCLSCSASAGSGNSPLASGTSGAELPSVAIRRKMSPRNSSSSLVKPMMLTRGERRSWLTI